MALSTPRLVSMMLMMLHYLDHRSRFFVQEITAAAL